MKLKMLVLGAGKMTSALLRGLDDLSLIGVYSPSGESARKLSLELGLKWVEDLSDIESDWVLLGCKPQQLPHVSIMIPGNLRRSLFISMLAAVSEDDQRRTLGVDRFIRIMPNLAVAYGKGVSLLSSTSAQSDLPTVTTYFASTGLVKVVNESELEELTLLTGSGPGLVYEFGRTLAGSFSSLTPSEREALVRQLLIGCGESLRHTSDDLGKMIGDVTSKGGVTIAVLEEWRSSLLSSVIQKGILAGKRRAIEISEALRRS